MARLRSLGIVILVYTVHAVKIRPPSTMRRLREVLIETEALVVHMRTDKANLVFLKSGSGHPGASSPPAPCYAAMGESD